MLKYSLPFSCTHTRTTPSRIVWKCSHFLSRQLTSGLQSNPWSKFQIWKRMKRLVELNHGALFEDTSGLVGSAPFKLGDQVCFWVFSFQGQSPFTSGVWDPLEHQFTNYLDLNQNIITSPLPLFSDREGNTTLKIYKFVSLFVKESVVNRFSDQYFGRFAIDNSLPGSAGSQGHWDEQKSNLPPYWERLFHMYICTLL